MHCFRFRPAVLLGLLLSISLMITGCSQGTDNSGSSTAAPVSASVATGAPGTSPDATPPSAPVANMTAGAGETRSAACPPLASVPPPAAPPALSDAPPAVLQLLNSGASVAAVTTVLTQWGMTSTNPSEVVAPVTSAKVLPGADAQMIVVLYDPIEKDPTVRSGDVLVFGCSTGKFALLYRAADDPAFGGQVPNPRLLAIRDVTGDGLADIAFVTGECTAATCVRGVTVLAQLSGTTGLTDISTDINAGPTPVFSFVPSGRDASQALVIGYGTLDDVNAGPQRAYTETWMLAGSSYTLTASVKDPPVFRVHALHDADAAFRQKSFSAAAALYQRVISDATLESWEGPGALTDEQSVLAAFSQFRLAELAAAQGNVPGVQAAISTLQASVKPGSPAEVYAKMAFEFSNQLKDSGSFLQACNSVIVFAEHNQSAFHQLGGDVFGFSNVDYQPGDMCIKP